MGAIASGRIIAGFFVRAFMGGFSVGLTVLDRGRRVCHTLLLSFVIRMTVGDGGM